MSKFKYNFEPGQLIPPSEHLHYVKEDCMKPDKTNPNKKRRWIIVRDDRNGEEFSAQFDSIRAGETKHAPSIRDKERVKTRKEKYSYIPLYGKRQYRVGDILGPEHNIVILEEDVEVGSSVKRKCKFQNLDNGKMFVSSVNNVVQGQTSGVESLGEEKIRKNLELLNINFIQEHIFNDLVSNNNGKPRFDFYLPDYNCCIEYDGIQHFIESHWNNIHNSLKERQQRDNLKTRYCQDNNIKLIRIPYWDYNKINTHYLLERLN